MVKEHYSIQWTNEASIVSGVPVGVSYIVEFVLRKV